jgi:hypothetical protein
VTSWGCPRRRRPTVSAPARLRPASAAPHPRAAAAFRPGARSRAPGSTGPPPAPRPLRRRPRPGAACGPLPYRREARAHLRRPLGRGARRAHRERGARRSPRSSARPAGTRHLPRVPRGDGSCSRRSRRSRSPAARPAADPVPQLEARVGLLGRDRPRRPAHRRVPGPARRAHQRDVPEQFFFAVHHEAEDNVRERPAPGTPPRTTRPMYRHVVQRLRATAWTTWSRCWCTWRTSRTPRRAGSRRCTRGTTWSTGSGSTRMRTASRATATAASTS